MILALDMASTFGWALWSPQEGGSWRLVGHGHLTASAEDRRPGVLGHYDQAWAVIDLLQKHIRTLNLPRRTSVVVEDTNIGGRAGRSSQKMLEFIHCLLIQQLGPYHKLEYVTTRQWHSWIGLALSQADRDNNKLLSQIRRKLREKLRRKPTPKELSEAKKAAGIEGKRTIKHASVEWANRTYGLQLAMKDEDEADAICIGSGYIRSLS